jgi:uncharacterized protein (TIGR02118 family)
MKRVERLELTCLESKPDGSQPAYYRMAELYFSDKTQRQQTLDSPEAKAAIADLSKFATGGVTMLYGSLDR